MSLDLSALSELNLNTPKGKKLLDNLISEKDILQKLDEYKQRYPEINISEITTAVQKELSDLYENRGNTDREARRVARKKRREERRLNREQRRENAEQRLRDRLEESGVLDLDKERSRIGAEIAILFAKLKNNKPEITEFLVSGRILDTVTNEPIQGAEVFLGVNPNPFEDFNDVSTFEDKKSTTSAPLSEDELELLANISSKDYDALEETNPQAQRDLARVISEFRTKRFSLATTGKEYDYASKITITPKQLGRLIKRTEVIQESEGLDLTVNPNNFLYVPVKKFKNPNFKKDKKVAFYAPSSDIKETTGNLDDPTKPVTTDKFGYFTLAIYVPIIRITEKCTIDIAILTKKSPQRDTNGERIKGTGYTPGTFILLNGDRTIKNNIGIKGVTQFSNISKEIVAEYNRRIDEAGDKINQIALGAAEWVLSQRKTALNKLSNTIKSVLLPLIISLMLQFGITKLSQANRKTCPTQGELDSIIRRRNSINRQLNNVYKTIIANTAIAAAFLVLANVLRGVRLSLDALPFPQAIGVPPAKDFGGLIFSQPYSASAKLQRINEQLEELSANNKELNKAILTNLIFVIAGLATVVVILKAIDGLIQECAEENGNTEVELDVINQELLDLAEEGEEDGNPIIPNINGFELSVETDNSNPVGTLKRRFAVAKDTRGITLLKGEPSFSSSDQILIDELVFYIQQNNLKAF